MGLYYRTLEMSRHLPFACYRCGPDVVMRARLISSTELELACDTCDTVLLVVVKHAIPRGPDDLSGVVRYKLGAHAIAHGTGLRCHNCGSLLVAVGKGEL